MYMYTAISPIPLSTFAGEPTQNVGKSFLKSYAAVCLEGAIIVLACIIFSVFAASPPVVDPDAAAASMVWSYIGELLADYLVDDTERFAEILAKKSTKEWESEKKAAQGELTKAEMRIEMIPKLLKKLYEDNLSGKTSDDDYSILSQEYSVERDQLKKKILGLRDKLKGMEDRAGEREAFVKAIRKFMSMKTLTAPLLRELIDHIDVYEVEGQGKNKTQRVVIYYKFVGYLEIPNDLSRPTYSADLREGVSVEYITCEAGEDILDEEA